MIDSLCAGIPTWCQLHVIHNGEIVPGAAQTTAAPWTSDGWIQTTDGHTLKSRLQYIVGALDSKIIITSNIKSSRALWLVAFVESP